MNFVFTNSALAPLLALISLPVLIHLFARSRPKVYRFTAVEFLRKIVMQTARIRRPRSWLLLILRTLLFAALILAFLKPVLTSENPLAGRFEKKNVVILVDASASMAALDGPRTRYAAACAKAAEVLSGLSSGDSANVVWIRTPSRPEFPSLGLNFPQLEEALRRSRPTLEAADVRGAFEQALRLFRNSTGRREIHVISDFQQTSWNDFLPPPLDGARLVVARVGGGEVPNGAIASIHTDARRVLSGEACEVLCEIFNYSSEPSLRTAFLRAGEITASREVRIPAWSSNTAAFECRFRRAGEEVIRISLDEDAFTADNERAVVIDVRERLRVGISGDDAESAGYWNRALRALGWVEVTPLKLSDSLDKLDAIVIAGWDGANIETITAFLKSGGAVICQPSAALELAQLARLVRGESAEKVDGTFKVERLSSPARLRIETADHPLFKVFSTGAHGNPAGGSFTERLRGPALEMPGARTILRFDDSVPALVEFDRNGLLWFWNVPLGPASGGWANRMEFVPLLGELLLYSRRNPADLPVTEFQSGRRLERRFDQNVLDEDVSLTATGGEFGVERVAAASGVTFISNAPVPPGVYQWKYQSNEIGNQVVNFPPRESDLRLLEKLPFATEETVTLAAGETVTRLREGTPLWPWLLSAAVICALAEIVTVWRTQPV